MRVLKFCWKIAPLAATLWLCSCQSSQRPVALLSSQQSVPPAIARAAAPASNQQQAAQAVQVPEPSVAVQAPGSADPVADLISKVEKEFQAGQDQYKAGHLEAARQSFDRAFDLLLGSNLEVHSDPRLEAEFDRILDGINSYEMQALQQGDGFTEQKAEPAPIDEANEANVPVDANVKAKAEAEIKSTASDLPLMMTDQVAGYISYFSGRGRGTLENALVRSGRYEDMIRRILKEEGVPQDLIYLAQAESGFHPLALSRVGARGIWQFMASRARGYGLQRDWWIDDRQDPEKATRAAARHLKDLYQQFGDWYLAMAAYNSGPGTVQSAVKRTGYADFWELYRRNVLPKETRNYVPIIVAVTIMAKNPGQYGLDHLDKSHAVAFDTVTIDYPVDLRLAAECVDVSVSDLQDLNPSLLRMTTPKDKEFVLKLPAGTKDKFNTGIAAIPPDMRVWWRYHKVKPGDTLASVAREYRTTAKEIAQANDLDDGQALTPDSRLTIPIAPGKRALSEEATYSKRAIRYKIRKGDTVQRVADNFGVSPAMVRRWNHLKSDSLKGRTVVYVHLPVTPTGDQEVASTTHIATKHKSKTSTAKTSSDAVVHHKVKQGETLFSIASAYRTTVDALKRDNRNVAVLRPGMVLVIRP